MAYRIAGIDIHKKMLAVVVADVDVAGEWCFERRQCGTSPSQLQALAEWLTERDVEEVVMESTALYWRPVWEALERQWQPTRRRGAEAGPMMNSATKARFLFRGLFLYRLLRTKSVIRVVNHDRCDLPSGVGLLHQVDDAGPLQFFSVGLATYGDAPGDHGGCAQPFEVKVD